MKRQIRIPVYRRAFHVARTDRGAREFRHGEAPQRPTPGRLPRLSRLKALAIHFDRVLATGRFQSQADLARAGQVTRARLTQILNLTGLAPDLQEKVLFLQPYTDGRAPLTERQIRPIAAEPNWEKQRRLYAKLAGPADRSDQRLRERQITSNYVAKNCGLQRSCHPALTPVRSSTLCREELRGVAVMQPGSGWTCGG